MNGDICSDILRAAGFRQIGSICHRITLAIWWHEEHRIQIVSLPLGSKHLVRGTKPYYLKSIDDEGETWVREIAPLQDYLEEHFPEIHLSFSHFRNITPTLAASQIRRKTLGETPTIRFPTVEELARLERAMQQKKHELRSAENLLRMQSRTEDLLHSHENRRVDRLRSESLELQAELEETKEKGKLFQNLQMEYVRKGSAACLRFSLTSNLHLTSTPQELRDAVGAVVKELTDAHRYQVYQKLGVKLNICVEEATEPALVWIEEWLGGSLSPRQMEKLKPEFESLRATSSDHMMVTANEDILIDGHVKESRKRMAAHVVSSLARRLDRKETIASPLRAFGKESLPAKIGLVMHGGRIAETPVVLPLLKQVHNYISGKSGSGKSYMGRVLVEEAAQYEDLNILVLDPRNQWAGMLVPEDRQTHLSLYSDFGMKPSDARGFPFDYYSPGQLIGKPAPADLAELGRGRSIVSLKGLDDSERCRIFHEILDAVFESYTCEESVTLKLLILIEEAQLFTKKRVDDKAKMEGERAERSLDRMVREIRKYGGCVVILSQTIRDFAYDSASIRQNTNTKIFMHNSDREVDYAATYLENGKDIIQLTPGTALVYNPEWGVVKVKVRPPLSKVWEFSADATRELLFPKERVDATVSLGARNLLDAIGDRASEGSGINVTETGVLAGISSKRALHELVDELERAGLVRTKKLRQRGQPRIIEVIRSAATDRSVD